MAETRISRITRRGDSVRPLAQKAQDAAKSKEKTGGKGGGPSDTGPEVYRYPREALSNTTDALFISIFDQFRTNDAGASNLFNLGNLIVEGKNKEGKRFVKGVDLNGLGVKSASDFFQRNQDKEKRVNAKYILLPIPQQISDALAVSYSEDSLNPLQAVGLQGTQAFLEGGPGVGLDLVRGLTNTEFKGLDQGTVKTIQSGLAAKALNSLGANVSGNSVISRATGQILQSNLELLFSGVTLRSFPFTFDFTPRDQVEAREVMAIIRCLKSSMVPKKGSNPTLFIGSPKIFQLEYVTGHTEHPFLNKFKICSLAQMNVNYTASGTYATYPDGTPVHIQVLCEFKEINPIYAEDYEDVPGGVGY